MPFRPAVKSRKGVKSKYSGIYEYYKSSDPDRVTKAFYIAIRDSDGKVRKVKTDAKDKDKDEALKLLNSERSRVRVEKRIIEKDEHQKEQRIRHHNMSFDDMAELYYGQRTTKNNHKDQRQYQNHLSPMIGNLKVSSFSTQDVVELQEKLLGKNIESLDIKSRSRTLSPKSVDNILDQLRAMFNEGMRDKNNWCLKNPVADKDVKKLTKDEDKSRLRILSKEELVRLFELASEYSPRIYLFMKVLYHTAARPDAIISLQVKDVSFAQSKIYLKAMKQAKAYSVPMIPEIANMLKEWIDEHQLEQNHYIFYPLQTGDKTKPAIYENFRNGARNIMDDEFNKGIPTSDRKHRVSLYTLRHTAATQLVSKLGIKVAKEYLQHSDLKVTEIYAKVVDEQMVEAAYVL
jgi:integrase